MFTNVSQIEILSRNPLWYINEEGQIGYIQNTYSDAELICVIKDDHVTKYPIQRCLTVVPELNTVLFETQEYAIIGISMMQDEENQNLLLQNAVQRNLHDNCYVASYSGTINSGLYSYSKYDELVKNINVSEVRYLDRNEKIKLIHKGSEVDPQLETIFEDYMKYEDVKSSHHSLYSERLIFDVITEDGKIYIKSFWLNDNGIDIGPVPFMISPFNGFLMFSSKPNAAIYRNDVREGLTTPFTAMVGEGQLRAYNGNVRKHVKETKKEGAKAIVSGVKDIVMQFVSLDQIFGFITNKTAPNIIKHYKQYMRKHNAKKRKAAFMKKQKKQAFTI